MESRGRSTWPGPADPKGSRDAPGMAHARGKESAVKAGTSTLVVAVALLVATWACASEAEIRVAPDGTGDFAAIQPAIDAAADAVDVKGLTLSDAAYLWGSFSSAAILRLPPSPPAGGT
jgi:hypothetical protein